jgi:asparaginyl-tRNA synthetase
MSSVHIDEAAGSDETGKGTQELPFKTLAFAVYSSDGLENVKYLTRKNATTEYDEATQSALKKAKKGADGIEKKKKKAEELAAREDGEKRAERERKEKLLEESKKIVLEEDPALPNAVKVQSRCKMLSIATPS